MTIPNKIEVIKYLDDLDHTAKKANAVNTVTNIQGVFKGYNTDIYGFIEPLHKRKVNFDGMTILLLGSGRSGTCHIADLLGMKKGYLKLLFLIETKREPKSL